MARPTANLRMFVAVYPPAHVARALLDLLPPGAPRATPAAQIHLTLHFIGDVPTRELDDLTETLYRCAAGLPCFSLTPQRLVTLPERGAPRLIAALTDAPAPMMELQRRLAHRLARAARPRPGDRYLPHLTLARFAHEPPSSRAASADEEAPGALRIDRSIDLAPFPVDHFSLMRSTLGQLGAVHHEVLCVPFEA